MVKSKRTTPRLCSGKTKLNDRSKSKNPATKKEQSRGIPQRKQCMFRYKMCKRNTDFPGSFLKHSASAKSIVSMLMVMVVSEPLRKPAKLTPVFLFLYFYGICSNSFTNSFNDHIWATCLNTSGMQNYAGGGLVKTLQ